MRALYVNLGPYLNGRVVEGFQFYHTVEVIDYLEKPLFGPHENFALYEIGYCIKEVLSNKPFRAVVIVTMVMRRSCYISLDQNKVFRTQRGKQFYPNGILNINLPKVGDEFEVIDSASKYDLIKGYIYSLHKVNLHYNNEEIKEVKEALD